MKKLDRHTFGCADNLKMLDYLTEKIGELDRNHRNYISTFIGKFNGYINQLEKLDDNQFKRYVANVMYRDYKEQIKNMKGKFDDDILSYLQNFVKAKITVFLNVPDNPFVRFRGTSLFPDPIPVHRVESLCRAAFHHKDVDTGLPFDYTDDSFDEWKKNNLK